jgi:hypothetical protein
LKGKTGRTASEFMCTDLVQNLFFQSLDIGAFSFVILTPLPVPTCPQLFGALEYNYFQLRSQDTNFYLRAMNLPLRELPKMEYYYFSKLKLFFSFPNLCEKHTKRLFYHFLSPFSPSRV